MSPELERLDRLRAERMALLRERHELLTRGSAAMRKIQGLRACRKPTPVVRPDEGDGVSITRGPTDVA